MTEPELDARPYYLAVFGRAEVRHFRDAAAMDDFIREEMAREGMDVDELTSASELREAYISHIHARDEGPVQWDPVICEASAAAGSNGRDAGEAEASTCS